MAKQVIRYRTCDKCTNEVEAAVTDKITFNGSRYEIDLCETHSLELFGQIMKWADIGTKTGDAGIFEQQRQASKVTVAVDVKPTAAAVAEVAEVVEEAAPSTPVTPIRKTIAGDPDLPLTASRWHLTTHAKEQMKSRGFTLAQVLWAAERPDVTISGKVIDGEERRQDQQERTKGNCTAVVNPHDNAIITVLYPEGEALRADRKAQG